MDLRTMSEGQPQGEGETRGGEARGVTTVLVDKLSA